MRSLEKNKNIPDSREEAGRNEGLKRVTPATTNRALDRRGDGAKKSNKVTVFEEILFHISLVNQTVN